jgi:hypothetical protein
MLTLQGSPDPLDEVLKPFIRVLQVLMAGGATALAWWLTPVWTWPLPGLLLVFALELILWTRGDRVFALQLSSDRLHFDQGKEAPPVTLLLSELSFMNLYYQETGGGRFLVLCVLGTEDRRLGFQLECEGTTVWEPSDVPIDLMTALFGGNPALLRAMVSRDCIVGQVIRDPNGHGLDWLRANIRPRIDPGPHIRVWTGLSPALDPHGLHIGEPDGHLTVTESGWQGPSGDLRFSPGEMGLFSRVVAGRDAPLPLLVLPLNETDSLCFPAPALPTWWETARTPDIQSMHAHLAEGIAVFWAYLRSAETLPAPLQQALKDLQGLIGPLPKALDRHL